MEQATHSPSADSGAPVSAETAWRPSLPRTLQGRLSLAFVGVVALTLALVAGVVLNRLDDYFFQQERSNLELRATAVANIVKSFAVQATETQTSAESVVVTPDGQLSPAVQTAFRSNALLPGIANKVAQANVRIVFGTYSHGSAGDIFVPASSATFSAQLSDPPGRGQARDPSIATDPAGFFRVDDNPLFPWAIEVTLANPYTTRASTLAAVEGLLAVAGLAAFIVAMAMAALLARRFAAPLRRLTEASRSLAEGDLTRRVPEQFTSTGTAETAELSRQFNAMADRVEETMGIISRDRDRSRDFLADVSHELRTPLAALRTFNELLQEGAAEDPEARTEFLESSRQQIERLDWLAHNLLELSKLDSGLLQLDLRPEDLRATVESAVEQAELPARRRGLDLHLSLPSQPLRVRHDPPRVGQVVGNLLSNALKFTPRGGSVAVELASTAEGARIEVRDSGVGIDASELPHIFERFYRGSRSNEARSSGSGLGLAIARSIVEMHGGRIGVESRLGKGSTFRVVLPKDPRKAAALAPPVETEGTSERAGVEADGRAAASETLRPDAAGPEGAGPAGAGLEDAAEETIMAEATMGDEVGPGATPRQAIKPESAEPQTKNGAAPTSPDGVTTRG